MRPNVLTLSFPVFPAAQTITEQNRSEWNTRIICLRRVRLVYGRFNEATLFILVLATILQNGNLIRTIILNSPTLAFGVT